MLEVDIDKILPVTEARDSFNKIVDEVEGSDEIYVLTKNGKPSVVVVGVNHLEKLTGITADELTSIVEKKADKTPVVEEIKKPEPIQPATPPPAPEPAPDLTPAPPTPEPSTQIVSPPAPTPGGVGQNTPPTQLETPTDETVSGTAPGQSNQTPATDAGNKDDDLFV